MCKVFLLTQRKSHTSNRLHLQHRMSSSHREGWPCVLVKPSSQRQHLRQSAGHTPRFQNLTTHRRRSVGLQIHCVTTGPLFPSECSAPSPALRGSSTTPEAGDCAEHARGLFHPADRYGLSPVPVLRAALVVSAVASVRIVSESVSTCSAIPSVKPSDVINSAFHTLR